MNIEVDKRKLELEVKLEEEMDQVKLDSLAKIRKLKESEQV